MAILKRHKSSIHGLTEDLFNLNQAIANEATARAEADGDLTELTTDTQENLVAAINEVLVTATAGEGSLKISENLGDLNDVVEARTNLGVMSAAEVAAAIEVAQVEMGTNFTVDDITARNALTQLDLGDRVLVLDADGEGKWAIFAPKTIVEGAVTEWTKLYDQGVLENSMTAAGVKAAYESNEDTNAYTDTEKTKVANALVADDLIADIDDQEDNQDGPATAEAVKTYVASKVSNVDQVEVALERLVVNGSKITLANVPRGGVAGVLNFATVRYVNQDGIAYDAPVVATGEANEFNISTDTADQWDGFEVSIQYVYI